jgi:uncharacterized protein (TIGR03437 family)
MMIILCFSSLKAQNILTGGYDLGRTNADLGETILSPSTVQPSTFGKLFSLPVDGQIAAQPLYEQSVPIQGKGVHNVVFVETQHNSVYAFDADTPAVPLWTVNLGPSVDTSDYNWAADGPYQDITPEVGILGTPVIDPATGTLYVVAGTVENSIYYYRLHALDTSSGAERFGGPTVIAANGFEPLQHIQRPALLLLNGVVYVTFGSHGDGSPWHGWMMGYSASNVQKQTAAFNVTPTGEGGAIWQSGRGPAVDSQGNIYLVTSNGDSDNVTNFSDSVLRLDPDSLAVKDWFAPSNQQALNDDDDDLGSSGVLLVPGTSLMITGGKQGYLYLLNTSDLGHISATDSQVPQTLNAVGFGIFNMALWNRTGGPILYLMGANLPFTAYQLVGNKLNPAPISQSAYAYAAPFQGMTISANGGQPGSGILWATTPDSWPLPAAGTLHAFNADDLSSELWNSATNDADALGSFSRFANPTVANGKVYLPTLSNQLMVYGLLVPATSKPVITGLVNAASYAAGPVAPGEILAMFGQNLGPAAVTTGSPSLELAGIQVTFNGIPAPLVYVSSGQLGAVAPFEIASAQQATVQVTWDNQTSTTETVPVAASAPGIFTLNASGSGPGAILNQDYSVNSPTQPAAPGSIIMLYATGGGVLQSDGLLAAPATASIGGQAAKVLYAGAAPDEITGMVQVNIQLPMGVIGNVPVIITVGGVSSQATATVVIAATSAATQERR